MRNRSVAIATALAMMGVGSFPIVATADKVPSLGKAQQSELSKRSQQRRSLGFVGVANYGYLKRERRTVAQDKRDARKARNRARARR